MPSVTLITRVLWLVPVFALGFAAGHFSYHGRLMARRMNSDERFAQLALALESYHQVNRRFPSLTWTADEGGPQHSWRIALLPFMESQSFFDEYDASLPWNHAHNLELCTKFPFAAAGFSSPLARRKNTTGTDYVGYDASAMEWPYRKEFARRTRVVTRGSEFFIIVEVLDSGLHWMEPSDSVGVEQIE